MTGSQSRRRAVALVGPLAIAMALVLGCLDDAPSASVESSDYQKEWSASRPTGEQIANSARRTGKKDVDGILDSLDAMADMDIADAKHKDARGALGADNPELAAQLLDEAIALRPDDARYRRDRAITAVRQGDAVTALEQWEEQDRIAALNRQDERLTYWDAAIAEATAEETLMRRMPAGPDRTVAAYALYKRLSELNQRAAELASAKGMDRLVGSYQMNADGWADFATRMAEKVEQLEP